MRMVKYVDYVKRVDKRLDKYKDRYYYRKCEFTKLTIIDGLEVYSLFKRYMHDEIHIRWDIKK